MAPLGLPLPGHPVKVGDHQVAAGDLRRPDEGLGGIGGEPVVPVGKLEVLALGQVHGLIPGVGHAAVGLVQGDKAAVGGRRPVTQGGGAVGTAVVHQEALEIGVALGPDALYALLQVGRHVVDRNDDADQGLTHGSGSLPQAAVPGSAAAPAISSKGTTAAPAGGSTAGTSVVAL